MDIYARLKKDHDTQRALGEKIVETEGDSNERRALWRRYRVELEAHASAEEQTFYAELMSHPEASDQTRHSVSEHKDAADLVEEIEDMDMSSPGWLTKFKQLKHDIEHHVDEEEEDVFDLARKTIDDAKAEALTDRFNERKPAEEEKEAAK
ncbi:hemerythrin domain-containing protein [Aquisalinus flavus]|uniref:Hemerythrin-like domain-containing protein n=1 Tax=Aquisalinus flavus TaxID=1526572 RepID=A0A8J2V2Y5_9PROT|nr:hemerythrin domain-containing protein [Aquisalinus flavus]MBD0426628.1 hemerythrin domain-containing protein [Aquisalinus flavus]UNE47828.1 hemerythrin domain-containing protein [Aquisalinus flavus]GGD06352.1 hypothetical protein GCM10011342_14040 [Aquisalinus flavus]